MVESTPVSVETLGFDEFWLERHRSRESHRCQNRAKGATVVASGVRLTTRIMKRHRVESDEGTCPAQTLERFRHEVWMGKKSQNDEDAWRQVKLSEEGEHKIEGDATNKDLAIEGLWSVQNTTQAPALVSGNGSKNEMHTGDFWLVVTQTMEINLQQNDCWPLNKAKVSEGIVRSHYHTPSGHHRLEIWELHPEKLSLIVDDLGILRTRSDDDGTKCEKHQRCNAEGYLRPTGCEGDQQCLQCLVGQPTTRVRSSLLLEGPLVETRSRLLDDTLLNDLPLRQTLCRRWARVSPVTNDKTCFAEGADWSIIAMEGSNPEQVRKRRTEKLHEPRV